jgi:hypothetical protein
MDAGCSPAPNAVQYEVLLCLPTAPALPMCGTETSVRRRFFRAALGQTAACLYLFMCGLRCKVQWVSRNKPPEIALARLGLTELIDTAVRSELGRYKTTPEYRRFRHKERHMANASFGLGMVASIADKLTVMKAGRDKVNYGSGRAIVVLKAAIVDAEFGKLDLKLRVLRGTNRMVSTMAYEAGGAAGESLAFDPGIRES